MRHIDSVYHLCLEKTTYCLSSDVVNHDIEDFFKEDNEEFTRRRQLKEKRLMVRNYGDLKTPYNRVFLSTGGTLFSIVGEGVC